MPHLPHSIELHDSEISAIEERNGAIVIKFSHAYIHMNGKGWSQQLDLIVNAATQESEQTSFPAKVSDGKLKTKLGPYHNLLILPLDTDGDVEMLIEFFTGKVVTIRGSSIHVSYVTEPVFLENVT